MGSILKEISIFEAVQHSRQKTTPMPTTSSFHMATNKGTRDRPKKDPTCVFCKGTHKPNLCTTVSSPKERLAIIKNAGLCFNCFGHHKLSQCASKFACRECHKKHHTSLCHAFTVTFEPPPQTLSTHRSTTAVLQNHTTPQLQSTQTQSVPRPQTTQNQTAPQNSETALYSSHNYNLQWRNSCYFHVT